MICSDPPNGTLQLPWTHLAGNYTLPWICAHVQINIGVPGLGSEPGPPAIAPFDWSGVNIGLATELRSPCNRFGPAMEAILCDHCQKCSEQP